MDKDEHYFFNQLQNIVDQLNELDELGKQCSVEQSKCDQEISDWLHRIQNEDLDDTEYIKIGKKIKEVRIKREHIYNVWELYKVYTNEKERLQDRLERLKKWRQSDSNVDPGKYHPNYDFVRKEILELIHCI